MKRIIKSLEMNGYALSDSMYPTKLKQPRHTHETASFSLVLKGNYIEKNGNRTLKCSASTIIFRPPQESHSVEYASTVRILSVQFDSKRLEQIREHSIILDELSTSRSERIAQIGNRIYQEFDLMDSFSGLAIEGLILEILAESSRSRIGKGEKSIPYWLIRAREFIHDNFAESFALENVAKFAGVHPVHLSRVFREKFGCTIGEYMRRCRLEFASRQIRETDTPLYEIASAAGFADHSHFNRTFRKYFSLTPSEYKKISRRG